MNQSPIASAHRRWFVFGAVVEGSLTGLAVVLAWLFHCPLWSELSGGAWAVGLGLLGALPMLIALAATCHSSWGPLREIRELLETRFLPLFASWSVAQLALISALAGLGEELLFRGVLQGGLTPRVGLPLAMVISNIIFGACHLLTRTYGLMAALMGAYFGMLWLQTGSLLTPVVAHAAYDFLALLYFVHRATSAKPDAI